MDVIRCAGACLVGVMLLVGGCAGMCPLAGEADEAGEAGRREVSAHEAERRAVLELRPRERVAVYSGDGSPVAWEGLVGDCASADAVLIGELHGHAMGLSAAASLWEGVLENAPEGAEPALCLEFFERDQQLALDDYLAGITDEETFREHARRTGGNYPAGHSAMVEMAKEAGAAVIAANVPRRYVRMGRDGYEAFDGLNPSQRSLVVAPERMPGEEYHERFVELMMGMGASHGGGESGASDPDAARAMAEAFYRSQVVWDATMSDSVARAIEAGHRPVFLVVGRFHVDRYGGTLELLEGRVPEARVLTISVLDAVEPGADDLGRADYLVCAGSGGGNGAGGAAE